MAQKDVLQNRNNVVDMVQLNIKWVHSEVNDSDSVWETIH